MSTAQNPDGTKRHGIGERPYGSYSIVKVDAEGNETQIGLTHRVEEDGKTVGWIADTGKEKSTTLVVHREAIEFLLGSRPAKPAAKAPAKKATPKPPAKTPAKKAAAPKSSGKAPAASDPEAGESQDVPKADLTAALAESVKVA